MYALQEIRETKGEKKENRKDKFDTFFTFLCYLGFVYVIQAEIMTVDTITPAILYVYQACTTTLMQTPKSLYSVMRLVDVL